MKLEPETPPDLSTRLALRPAEAARALGISERTLRAMLPRLPVVRSGGLVLITLEALRDCLRERALASAKDAENLVEGLLRDLASRDG